MIRLQYDSYAEYVEVRNKVTEIVESMTKTIYSHDRHRVAEGVLLYLEGASGAAMAPQPAPATRSSRQTGA